MAGAYLASTSANERPPPHVRGVALTDADFVVTALDDASTFPLLLEVAFSTTGLLAWSSAFWKTAFDCGALAFASTWQ